METKIYKFRNHIFTNDQNHLLTREWIPSISAQIALIPGVPRRDDCAHAQWGIPWSICLMGIIAWPVGRRIEIKWHVTPFYFRLFVLRRVDRTKRACYPKFSFRKSGHGTSYTRISTTVSELMKTFHQIRTSEETKLENLQRLDVYAFHVEVNVWLGTERDFAGCCSTSEVKYHTI